MDERRQSHTRRLSRVLTDLEAEFNSFYSRDDFDRVLTKLERETKTVMRQTRQEELYGMLDACKVTDGGKEYKKGESVDYYRSLVEKSDVPKFLGDSMLYALYSHYREYPSPEEYIERLVDRLSAPEDGWEADPLRLRILKQFIKYGGDPDDKNWANNFALWGFSCAPINEYCKEKEPGCKVKDKNTVLRLLDDGIFRELDAMGKLSKSDRRKYALLIAIENLAQGGFQTGEATREILYLFAMVYDMTYYSGEAGEIIDYTADLEKNLFGDYYCNNIMRFLYNKEYRKGGLEKDPAERGINYKNFAEMICLYYISMGLEPWKKVKRAGEMIERVKAGAAAAGTEVKKTPEAPKKYRGQRTAYYQALFMDDLLRKPEAEFEAFLLDNYNCDPGDNLGVFQMETEQNRAFEEYLYFRDELDEAYNYGLWFTDVGAEDKASLESFPQRWTGDKIDREQYEGLLEILTEVNNLIGYTPKEQAPAERKKTGPEGTKARKEKAAKSKAKGRALSIESAKDMSRTAFLTVYYYWYNQEKEGYNNDRKDRSFRDVFNEFKSNADDELEQIGYMPLSGKNLFDVLLAFSIYARGLI